ncbi:hypothetical protein FPZ12_045080 [Amycolatopsis acidicola]|uniref:Glycoside hydrolase n=1 Tax=Amycolatopsis acidicola TaxID=2596893 RepID=A0A5N0UKY8_9PSEU|nr:glycosyl hydrolase [Amycolatopsis acidicola]KAA9148165.1 hypothetical protein FPZ12_045080 [Amycolatopsis acidicola]
MMRRREVLRGSVVVAAAVVAGRVSGAQAAPAPALGWGPVNAQTRPWTRWWWLGSAVTEAGLAQHLEEFARAGFGGVEVQPIYEAQGYEDHVLDYLSPQWLAALDATTRHARAAGLGVDLTTGSGWTMGGPWISPAQSAGRALVEHWQLSPGQRLTVPVRTTQPPHPALVDEEKLSRPDLRPPMDPLPDPPLAALVARDTGSGRTLDLTASVRADGTLDWTAPAGDWQLTGVFSGRVLKRVERAGPGGKGLLADYFDEDAIRLHLDHFGTAIGRGPRGIRALFHDSFELEDMDWTTRAVAEFADLRGYDLVPHLPALFDSADESDARARVLSDVRETFSDLFLDRFALPWAKWSAEGGWLTRNQAHGSPANLLDIYGAADIPETEYTGGELVPIPGLRPGAGKGAAPVPLVWRFASSPAHLRGKPLVGAETLTWRDEHYHVSLSQAKPTVDLLFSAGINHVVFHGTAYSPQDAPWPGFSFYASTELKPANTIWRTVPELTGYITRCQSVLQDGTHGNDVLVYWPQHDLWAQPDGGIGASAEDIELTPDYTWQGTWMYQHPTGAGDVAGGLEARGWQFDWVSDRQLAGFRGKRGGLRNDNTGYAVVVVPGARLMPLDTVRQLRTLADQGATVVFTGDLPADVPGLADLDARRAQLAKLNAALRAHPRVVVVKETELDAALSRAGAVREPIADTGLRVLRRQHDQGKHYFLSNVTANTVDGWYPLGTDAASVGALDPLHDVTGLAETRRVNGKLQVRVHLEPGESLILRTYDRRHVVAPVVSALVPTGREVALDGRWSLRFLDGGPEVPPARDLAKLVSWTELGEQESAFSGTARYTLRFILSTGDAGRDWLLDLGDVREAAAVRLNGRELGTAWSIPFHVPLGDAARPGVNVLELDVTNLAANRVRALARAGKLTTNFFMSWRSGQAPADWDPMPSGLLGPVRLLEV